MREKKAPLLYAVGLTAAFAVLAPSCKEDEPKITEPEITAFSLSTTEVSVPATENTTPVEVCAIDSWRALPAVPEPMLDQVPDWLILGNPNGEAGKDTLYITCRANTGYGPRSATVGVITGSEPNPTYIHITQKGADAGSRPAAYLSDDIIVRSEPFSVSGTKTTVTHAPVPLYFFGWGTDNDHRFTLDFPASTAGFNRAILTYRMGGGPQGCSDWDHTTYFSFKYNDEWYEIARCVTPYGNGLNASWEKKFYFDVTEYLPMLQGAVEFKVYYNGFDASASGRHHTAQLTFDLYEGTPARRPVYVAKLYDSERDGNSGYRGFLYGRKDKSIEDENRMSPRPVSIPANVKSLEMRVVISGHGADQGRFPKRPGYQVRNAAEFDLCYYTVKVNGEPMPLPGKIYILCGTNYKQAGTCYYDRANWCPGNPVRVERWKFLNINQINEIDIDFEEFEAFTNAENPAAYQVQIVLFGFDK